MKPKPVVTYSHTFSHASYMYLLWDLIGWLDCMHLLWLAKVITLALVLWYWIKNCSFLYLKSLILTAVFPSPLPPVFVNILLQIETFNNVKMYCWCLCSVQQLFKLEKELLKITAMHYGPYDMMAAICHLNLRHVTDKCLTWPVKQVTQIHGYLITQNWTEIGSNTAWIEFNGVG